MILTSFFESYLGEIISLGTALFWTISIVSFEYAGKRVGSISVNFIRLIFAFIFIGVTLFFMTGSFIPINLSAHAWSFLLLSGVVGLVIGDFFLFQALIDIGGRISLLIMSTVPILSAFLGLLFYQEVLTFNQVIGMIIVITSIIIVILSKREKEKKTEPHIIRGIIFAFIGAISQAVGLALSKEGMIDIQTGNGIADAFLSTEIRIIASIIGFILIITFNKKWKDVFASFKKKDAILFITLGSIFGPFIGVSSQLLAMRYTEMGVHSTISQLNVIIIIPFSVLLFKEKITWYELVATVTAFIGVAFLFL